jgi:hypothetical protein
MQYNGVIFEMFDRYGISTIPIIASFSYNCITIYLIFILFDIPMIIIYYDELLLIFSN